MVTGVIESGKQTALLRFTQRLQKLCSFPVLLTVLFALVVFLAIPKNMLGSVVAIVLLFPTNRQLNDRASKLYPDGALTYLRNFHPHGNVFNDYLWGGYLIWNVRQVPVFIDSRMDVFERNGILADYLHAIRIEDTLQILDKYSIRYVLFENHRPLSYLLQHTPGWKVDYQDKTTIFFERTSPLLEAPPFQSRK